LTLSNTFDVSRKISEKGRALQENKAENGKKAVLLRKPNGGHDIHIGLLRADDFINAPGHQKFSDISNM